MIEHDSGTHSILRSCRYSGEENYNPLLLCNFHFGRGKKRKLRNNEKGI